MFCVKFVVGGYFIDFFIKERNDGGGKDVWLELVEWDGLIKGSYIVEVDFFKNAIPSIKLCLFAKHH